MSLLHSSKVSLLFLPENREKSMITNKQKSNYQHNDYDLKVFCLTKVATLVLLGVVLVGPAYFPNHQIQTCLNI